MGGLMTRMAGIVLVAALVASCSSGSPEPAGTTAQPNSASPSTTTPPPLPPRFEVSRVAADIAYLADEIGPRHATSKAYARAVDWVEDRFVSLGYVVARQAVNAPAGNTWGVDVPSGNSPNVIADPPGFDATEPHRVVGAHLDTVPVAPGAEDNASGVSVMLELARMSPPGATCRCVSSHSAPRSLAAPATTCTTSARRRTSSGWPRLSAVQCKRWCRSTGSVYADPRCRSVTAAGARVRVRDQLAVAARHTNTAHRICGDNTTSDHWSFERAGLPGARIGSVPYAGYHSRGDTVDVVNAGQLGRVGRIMVAWLQS